MVKLYANDICDGVHCNNCDTDMLVSIGCETCPVCKFRGTMQWLDEESQELTLEQAQKKYPHIKVFNECDDIDMEDIKNENTIIS